jgi:hypothetical protein
MKHKKEQQDLKMCKEDKLMLLCSRTRMNDEIKSQIVSLIQQEMDWDYLLQRSYKHKLTTLLYWQLNKVSHDSVPKDVMEHLKTFFLENAQKNLLYMGELLRILELFDSHDITAIPYKGPILAIQAYGNLAFRQFDDLDIFIFKKDILKVKNLLISNGYKIQFQPKGLQEKIYLKSQRDYQFISPDNSNIEIHWNFIGLSFSCKHDIFKNPQTPKYIEINNMKISTLSDEDMLLILCVHASGHLWERISWICDITEFIRSNKNIDWQILIEKGELYGFQKILQINILLAVELLNLKVPNQILTDLNIKESTRNISSDIKRNLLKNNEIRKGVLYKAIMRYKIRENKSEKIKDFFKTTISHFMFPFISIFKGLKFIKT